MPEPSIVASIDDLQNNTNPPPLFVLGALNIFSHLIFLNAFFSLTSSAHVSAKNTTEGFFAHTKSASSFSVHGFPSPRQFHTRQLMVIGGVDAQPPPLNLMSFHHLLKPFSAFLGTPNDQYDLSSYPSVYSQSYYPCLWCVLVFSDFF